MPAGAFTERAGQGCAAGRCLETIDRLESEIRRQPSNPGLYQALGVCYAGACRPHSMVDAAMAAHCLRRALRLTPAENRRSRADILDALGNSLAQSRSATHADALREAVICHSEAAALYAELGEAEDWGRAEFNLGNSCCALSEAAAENHWGEAIAHYENALRVRTCNKDPMRHAAVLENMGSAWRHMPVGDPYRKAANSIECYRRALRIFVAEDRPEKQAGLQNNLGNAYLSFSGLNDAAGARNARRALGHFDRALRLQNDPRSRAYGITQYNRAQAFVRLARVTAAAGCLREASAAFVSCGEERYAQLACEQLEAVERLLTAERGTPGGPLAAA